MLETDEAPARQPQQTPPARPPSQIPQRAQHQTRPALLQALLPPAWGWPPPGLPPAFTPIRTALLGVASLGWLLDFVAVGVSQREFDRASLLPGAQGVLWFNSFLYVAVIASIVALLAFSAVAAFRIPIVAFCTLCVSLGVGDLDRAIIQRTGSPTLDAAFRLRAAGVFFIVVAMMGNIVVLGIDTPPPPDAIPPASATPPVPHPKSDIEACCVAVQADSLPPVPTIRRNSNALGSLHSVQSLHTLHSVRAVVAPPSPSSPPSPTQPLRAHTAPAAADLTLPEAPDMSLQEVIASAGQLRLSAISTPLPLDPKTSTESVVASPSNTHPGDVSVSDASRISRLDIPFPFRALALYDYTASPDDPTELSFARCDVLQIADIRGKWWYARRVSANGLSAVGIVPSNFMRLLSQ